MKVSTGHIVKRHIIKDKVQEQQGTFEMGCHVEIYALER